MVRAQDILRDIPKCFIDANSVAELLRLASIPCCKNKKILPTDDSVRTPPVRGFVCTGCGTAWNMTESLWDRTAIRLPVEYQDYFRNNEGMLALCAALNAGAPGVRHG